MCCLAAHSNINSSLQHHSLVLLPWNSATPTYEGPKVRASIVRNLAASRLNSPLGDQAGKPMVPASPDQGNFCDYTLAPECTGPVFWVNSGMTENPASRCQIVTVQDDLAYSLWSEQPTFCPTNSDNEIVLILGPAGTVHIATPSTITCGKIQTQASLEATTLDPCGKTIMSIRLLLAIEGSFDLN